MAQKISFDHLGIKINECFDEYSDDVLEALQTASTKYAKEGAKMLRKKSAKDTGDYAKDWTSTTAKTRLTSHSSIYNKKHYQLAHLLEYGHATYGGGRATGEKTKGDGIIAGVAEEITTKYYTEVLSKL